MIFRSRHDLSPRAMNARIARFSELPDYRTRIRRLGVPDEAIDLFGPKQIHQVMGPSVLGLSTFAIAERSALLSIAGAPPGDGPALHVHDCVETFFILEGRFRVEWGPGGHHAVELERWDTISIPAGVLRRFENVGESDGKLLAILSGGNLMRFRFPAAVRGRLRELLGPTMTRLLRLGGVSFLRR